MSIALLISDLVALKQLVSQAIDVGLLGQLHQLGQNLVVDNVFGEIKQNLGVIKVGEGMRQLVEPLGVLLEQLLDGQRLALGVIERLELLPRGKVGGLLEGREGLSHCVCVLVCLQLSQLRGITTTVLRQRVGEYIYKAWLRCAIWVSCCPTLFGLTTSTKKADSPKKNLKFTKLKGL